MPEVDDGVACVIVEPAAANMGVVAPAPGFLQGLRKACDDAGALLVFDEVITGFRVGRGGMSERSGVTPDLWCFGKVMGGGLPVGAFGGRRDVLSVLAPEGPVYQAGTLSGNPLATAAGLAVLETVSVADYDVLCRRAARLAEGLEAAISGAGIAVQVPVVGPLVGLFFGAEVVTDYASARATVAGGLYAAFFSAMLERGVALAPGPYEAMFPGLAHLDARPRRRRVGRRGRRDPHGAQPLLRRLTPRSRSPRDGGRDLPQGRGASSLPCVTWTGCRRHRQGPTSHPGATTTAAPRPASPLSAPEVPGPSETPPDGATGRYSLLARLMVVGAVLVVVFGIVLRFVASSDMWLDEALTFNIARLPLGPDPRRPAARRRPAAVLRTCSISGWRRSAPPTWGCGRCRACSAAPRCRSSGSRRGASAVKTVAAAALVLVATSPFAVRYATENRMYALVGFLTAAGVVALQQALRRRTVANLIAVAVITGAPALHPLLGALPRGGHGAVVGVPGRGAVPSSAERGALVALGAVVVGCISFVPWLPTFSTSPATPGRRGPNRRTSPRWSTP